MELTRIKNFWQAATRNVSLRNLQRAIQNPNLILRELQRISSLPVHHTYGYYIDNKISPEYQIMEKDWDNLIILDACRYDYFKRQCDFEGDLDRIASPGKMSWEFMQAIFTGRQFHDTIYITSNPYATNLPENTFFKIEYLIDNWDEDIGTIHPEEVVQSAIEAHRKYPNKRLIIHFMQPHRPYLGSTAEELRERVNLIGYRNQGEGLQIWGAVKQGEVSINEVRKAYSESLNIAMDNVREFMKEVDGKSVITADHGEMLGERVLPFTSRVWGHSEGFSTPNLRYVPWLEIPTDDRRDISSSDPLSSETLSKEEISERLAALGYAE